jgi:hypothetical protein
MSDSFIYSVGLQNVGSYQVSGQPFLSSSITVPANSAEPLEIKFDQVTKFVIIRNETDSADAIRVGFSSGGLAGTNYVRLAVSESLSADYKVTSVFLRSDTATQQSASIVAGLTNIPSERLSANWSGSNGVG